MDHFDGDFLLENTLNTAAFWVPRRSDFVCVVQRQSQARCQHRVRQPASSSTLRWTSTATAASRTLARTQRIASRVDRGSSRKATVTRLYQTLSASWKMTLFLWTVLNGYFVISEVQSLAELRDIIWNALASRSAEPRYLSPDIIKQ